MGARTTCLGVTWRAAVGPGAADQCNARPQSERPVPRTLRSKSCFAFSSSPLLLLRNTVIHSSHSFDSFQVHNGSVNWVHYNNHSFGDPCKYIKAHFLKKERERGAHASRAQIVVASRHIMAKGTYVSLYACMAPYARTCMALYHRPDRRIGAATDILCGGVRAHCASSIYLSMGWRS